MFQKEHNYMTPLLGGLSVITFSSRSSPRPALVGAEEGWILITQWKTLMGHVRSWGRTPLGQNKGPSSQSYGFSSSHVWMWELNYKESWALKDWCFWTVVLEKTFESPLDCKEVHPVHVYSGGSGSDSSLSRGTGLHQLSPASSPASSPDFLSL